MDERFEDHLRHPRNRGASPSGAHDGAAGGAACGDLVRISLRVEGDRVARTTFDASGCGAAQAAASAAVDLVDGAHVLDAARVGARVIAAELGGLSPGKLHAADLASDALHRALGAAVRADAAVPAAEDRVLVAMSGGVDSAVAALLTVEEAGQVAAVTLELWADPANDAERSCCSAAAVRVARSLAHDMGLPHFTLDLREEFRTGVVEPWLAGHAAGVTPNPCVRCNGSVRLDAMVAFADRLGAASLATGHYARLRDERLQLAEDRDKDQTYMLAATPSVDARAAALPARRHREGRGARAGRPRGPARRRQARLPGPLLPRRHDPGRVPLPARRAGGPPRRPRGRRRRRRRPSPRSAPLHRRTASRPGHRDRGAALRARQGRGSQHGDRGLARGSGDVRGARARSAAAAPSPRP